MPTFHDRRTGEVREVPEADLEWYNRDPEGFQTWHDRHADLAKWGEAMDEAYGKHTETFSWDNPNHYADRAK